MEVRPEQKEGENEGLRYMGTEERQGGRVWGVWLGRVCGSGLGSHIAGSERGETVSMTRVIVNTSAVHASVVTQGHTLWNQAATPMCR